MVDDNNAQVIVPTLSTSLKYNLRVAKSPVPIATIISTYSLQVLYEYICTADVFYEYVTSTPAADVPALRSRPSPAASQSASSASLRTWLRKERRREARPPIDWSRRRRRTRDADVARPSARGDKPPSATCHCRRHPSHDARTRDEPSQAASLRCAHARGTRRHSWFIRVQRGIHPYTAGFKRRPYCPSPLASQDCVLVRRRGNSYFLPSVYSFHVDYHRCPAFLSFYLFILYGVF